MPVQYSGVTFERLGHASVRMQTDDGTVMYIDPWGEVIEEPTADADIVFVTHDDRDHYDPEIITALADEDTKIVAYSEIDTSKLERETIPIGYEDSVTVDGIKVESVPAYNDPAGPHTDADGNPYHAKTEVIGLLLEVDGITVYFTSDSDFLDEHREITADVFIPPIGGNYTMDRYEAAEFAESVDPELVLPVHYNSDEVSGIDTDAEAFKEDIENRGIEIVLF